MKLENPLLYAKFEGFLQCSGKYIREQENIVVKESILEKRGLITGNFRNHEK